MWRILNLLILGAIAAGIFFTFSYIYKNVFDTLYNANIVTNLRTNAAIYELDLNAYEKAQNAIEKKKNVVKIPSEPRNIFNFFGVNLTTSTNATSTKK